MPDDRYFKYDSHQEEWDEILSNPERKKIGDSWLQHDTLDAWRHARLREPLNSIVKADPEASWLTIGDGRYGTDANYLSRLGATNVHCSDISETLLRIASEKGFIGSFSAENAEALSFSNNSFDFIYCKESLHHFPRPYAALFEMFRVARVAVIVTEPRDQLLDQATGSHFISFINAILGRSRTRHHFEPVGNYLYSISERELQKFLLGIHRTHIAFYGCNDAYIPGVELVSMHSDAPEDRRKISKIKKKIAYQDLLGKLGIRKSSILTAALFKVTPSEQLTSSMKTDGWDVLTLPSNPYLTRGQSK